MNKKELKKIYDSKELWYFLIEGQQDAETGIFGNFYSYGSHLGDALEKVIKVSGDDKFSNPNLIEASFLENFDVIENNNELVNIADGVYMRTTIHSFPFEESDKEFVPPVGIVKSAYDGEYEYDLIKENFVAYGANEDGIFKFELVLSKENLIETFLKTIDFLPSVDGFWIYIKSFWENDLTELWVAKHFTDRQIVKDFLHKQDIDVLKNGFLDIVVHSSEGETNLILDDHKRIQLHTRNENVFRIFLKQITDLGYKQTKDFYSLAFGYHHFHYRLGESLNRSLFTQMLIKYKFELIDKWEE